MASSDTGLSHLKIEPEIVCDPNDAEFAAVRHRGMQLLGGYFLVYFGFCFGSWCKKDLFAFLGDKVRDPAILSVDVARHV